MNKDVIYIDVDDDVTAIIGKIKQAKEKIVALVPPKRAGSLQSAVNLRLLQRMAKNESKQLVLITTNPGLVALAANAQIPVAKNLQSKPEVAEIPAIIVDDGDDIIDGADLPVGDHAKSVPVKDGTKAALSGDIDTTDLEIDGEEVAAAASGASTRTAAAQKAAKKGKNRSKIPNFDTFRKKLIFLIAGGIALVALLVWMFVFAPAATVIITASTSPSPISASVRLGGTAATNYEQGVVSSVSQTEQKEAVVEFTATGEKNVGEKASGTITVTNCDGDGFTLPAGTAFTSGGKTFYSATATVVSDLTGSASQCRNTGANAGRGTATVTASASGESFNIAAASYAIGGVSGDVYARGSAMTGGTSKVAKVVSAEDIERARGQLVGASTDTEKKALIAKFTNGEKVVESSFTVERGDEVATPAVDQEAPNGQAKLSVKTTYTIQAVSKSDLETFLKKYLDSKLEDNQKIYSTGVDTATLGNFRKEGENSTVTLIATGRVGPEINEAAIKEQVKGKIYGEVQQSLEAISGIKEVDVQFSYFWVRTVPNDINKIKIEFKVDDNE